MKNELYNATEMPEHFPISNGMSNIEQQVMGGVAVIHAARTLVSATALKVYVLLASVWAFGTLVWVAHVEQNLLNVMHGGALAVGTFALYAFAHTRLPVQAVVLIGLVAAGSLVVDIVRTTAPGRRFVPMA